jgi:hypothetical protein
LARGEVVGGEIVEGEIVEIDCKGVEFCGFESRIVPCRGGCYASAYTLCEITRLRGIQAGNLEYQAVD